jgi:hypothetical protein
MNGNNGVSAPTQSDLAGYKDASGNLQPVGATTPMPVAVVGAGGAGTAYTATATFTPAAAAYLANDIMDVAKQFAWVDKAGNAFAGGELMITTVEILISETAVQSGETSYTLQKYNVTPPSARADNAAWDLASGDRAAYVGPTSLGTPVDIGSSLYAKTTSVNEQITVAATGITFGELVTVGPFTSTATARKVTLHAVAM